MNWYRIVTAVTLVVAASFAVHHVRRRIIGVRKYISTHNGSRLSSDEPGKQFSY